MKQIEKLITITRSDITQGYQVVQTAHSIADFAYQHPNHFNEWKEKSNSIISLSVDSEEKLIKYYDKLSNITPCSIFFEPDVNQYTSICVYGKPEVRKKLSHLPLSLKNKENENENE